MLIKETDSSINFIDMNDKFVGYGLGVDCCENPGWNITTSRNTDVDIDGISLPEGIDLSTFIFVSCDPLEIENGSEYCAVFELTNLIESIYLHLFNVHNGYYSHKFEHNMTNERKEGYL